MMSYLTGSVISVIVVLATLPSAFPASTIERNKLFHNTVKRWNIDISDGTDLNERWKRFVKAKETVDRTTRGATLESLNRFSVLNDAEYETQVAPLKRQLNMTTLEAMMNDKVNRRSKENLEKRDDLPASYDYWENTVGMNTPSDQFGCGSCWAFPNVATMEALYKEQTGETVAFSQQYFVDCTWTYSGCAGGGVNDGYQATMERQYLMSSEFWPYTGYYQACMFDDDIASFTHNSLKKLWIADNNKLGTTESLVLAGLLTSPVAFGSYVSSDIFDYSGGIWVDSNCVRDPNSHAMLLVGYTESTLRVQNSYGAGWGEGGYANYDRYADEVFECNMYGWAYTLTVTPRREMQYEWCNNKKLGTRKQCQDSCLAMNTETETGWSLAVLPSKYHSNIVLDMIEAVYPGVKTEDKYNWLWFGLLDKTKSYDFSWADGFTPVNYFSQIDGSNEAAKYGMINKNTGKWMFRNNLSYKARGLCSRAVTCWDIGTAVANGAVTFDRTVLTEGAEARVECSAGYTLDGAATLNCVGGDWDQDLPACI